MPELPEVETIRRQLAKKIVGRKLEGKKIVKVRRRAKLLLVDFEDGSAFVFHLKLTGQLIFQGQPGRWTRQIFCFEDGSRLIFNDARKFGWWKKVKDSRALEKTFGPEPLTLGFVDFRTLLSKRSKSRIKTLLMDQSFIAGIGNIYSDEILFRAGVRPTRRAGTLTEAQAKQVFQKTGDVLKSAIVHQGSSVEHYVDACGRKGGYARQHKVYHKEQCQKCGAKIKKIKMGGRTAHFCPQCQR